MNFLRTNACNAIAPGFAIIGLLILRPKMDIVADGFRT